MDLSEPLFSWISIGKTGYPGKAAFFSDCAVLGNFDIYQCFLNLGSITVDKLGQFSMANFAIFPLFGIFLRYDLAINYVHHDCLLLQIKLCYRTTIIIEIQAIIGRRVYVCIE